MREMRLRDRDEHAHVVSRPENLREADVGSRFAAVVVRVDEVDTEALEPLEALAGGFVRGPCRADLCVVERHEGEEYACAVQVEIAAVDPEFSEAEANGRRGVEWPLVGSVQRN